MAFCRYLCFYATMPFFFDILASFYFSICSRTRALTSIFSNYFYSFWIIRHVFAFRSNLFKGRLFRYKFITIQESALCSKSSSNIGLLPLSKLAETLLLITFLKRRTLRFLSTTNLSNNLSLSFKRKDF